MQHRTRVWDLPTRIFHWSLVVLMVFSFVTAQLGGNWMPWHFRSGYCILTLITFRILWGFFGGRYARFANFFFTPSQIIAYLRGAPNAVKTLGHNPLGSLSVFGLIAFVALQAVTGLFSNDDISEEGPMVRFVTNATSNWFTSVHHIGEKVLIVMVLMHIVAVLYYLFRKRENLIAPMITGDKTVEDLGPSTSTNLNAGASAHPIASVDNFKLRLLALVLLAVCAALVAVLVNWPTGR